MTFVDAFVNYAPQIIGYASMLAAGLPEPKPGSVGAAIKGVVNVLALNVGNARNESAAQKKQRKAAIK